MPSPKYTEIVTNPYTGEEKEITASKEDVLQRKIYAQQDAWEQEQIIAEGKQAASEATAQLRVVYNYLRALSHVNLQPLTPEIYAAEQLAKVHQRRRYMPKLSDVEKELGLTKTKKLLSHISKSKKDELALIQKKAEALYNERIDAYNKRVEQDYAEYQQKCAEEKQKVNNLMRLLQSGSPTAANMYYTYALKRDDFSVDNQVRFIPEFHNFKFRRRPVEKGSNKLVGKLSLSYRIPNKEDIPAVAEFIYNQKANRLEEKEYDTKTAVSWRKRVAESVLLRAITMLFSSDPFEQIHEITITGYLRYYDSGYGQDQLKNVMRVTITRNTFDKINIENSDPEELFTRILKAEVSPGLYTKEPYAIVEID